MTHKIAPRVSVLSSFRFSPSLGRTLSYSWENLIFRMNILIQLYNFISLATTSWICDYNRVKNMKNLLEIFPHRVPRIYHENILSALEASCTNLYPLTGISHGGEREKKLPLSIFTASFTNGFHCRYDCNNSFYGQRLLLEGRADFVHIAFCALQRAPAVGSFNDLEKICFDMLWLSCESSFFSFCQGN